MPLNNLDHYLIRANDIEKTKQFYVEVLGMEVGYRPPFSFSGYWLYAKNKPLVHLIQASVKDVSTESQTSAISHIAFSASDLEGMLKRLSELEVPLKHHIVPEEKGAHQVFIVDPDGIKIELNFSDDA